MKVLRSTLFVAVTALVAAACGDKVTVPPAVTTTPGVNTVSVSPASVTLQLGGLTTATFAAAVNADAGVATTVTWTSSDATKASVGAATGVVTAVAATPGVAICATSTVNTSKVGCGSAIVLLATPTSPATISIQSITVTGNLNGTVNPANVAGGIDVRLNVNPGTQTVQKVILTINGAPVDSQKFTATQAAALRSAADEAIAAQSTFPQIVFSVNTANYGCTAAGICTPAFFNGAKTISAQLFTSQGGAVPATASTQSNLTFNNIDGFDVTTSNTGTANAGAGVVDAFGFRWNGNGALTINARPVMYSAKTVGTVTGSISNIAGGAGCVAGTTSAAVAQATATAGVYVIALPLAGFQSASCVGSVPMFPTIAATDNLGNTLTLVVGGVTNSSQNATSFNANSALGIRWDNVAPATAGLLANPGGRTNAWINDAVAFNAINLGTAATANNWIAAAVVDAGIGGAITYSVRAAATFATAKTATGLTNATTLAAGTAGTTTNADLCAIAYTTDLLGNTSGNPGGTCAAPAAVAGVYVLPAAGVGSLTFGVDRAPPTIAYSGGLAANARQAGANIGGEFSVTVSDTGLVGNSGMQPVAPVLMMLTRRIANGNGVGTTSTRNADGTASATAGVLASTGVNAAGNPIYTTAITGVVQTGYYSHEAKATDAAGNSSSITLAAGRTIVYDGPAAALVVGATSTPISVATIGWTANAFVNDLLDIQTQWFSGDYVALNGVAGFVSGTSATPTRFAQAQTAVNGFNAASLLNTNFSMSQAINLPLQIQLNVAATLNPLSGVEANAVNQGNTIVTGATAAAPTQVPVPAAIVFAPMVTFTTATNSIASNNISSGVTTAPTAGNPASGTLSVTATGPTATFNLPWSRVDWYAANNGGAAGTEFRLIGSTSVNTLVDVGAVRTFTWNLPISGATLYTQLGYVATAVTQVIAIGYNASGTVGMLNAGFYALNIIK